MIFNKEFVDMIYIDTERTDKGTSRTTLTMFDLGNGTSKPLVFGYSFEEQVTKIASFIDEKYPAQVIFDNAGASLKEFILMKLRENHNLELDRFGHTRTL
jgi:hypothetical protein